MIIKPVGDCKRKKTAKPSGVLSASSICGLWFLLAAVLMVFPAAHAEASPADAPVVSRVIIEVSPESEESEILSRLVRSRIPLQKDDRFSPELVTRSIEAIKNLDKFKDIHVDSREEQGKIAVIFQVTAWPRINSLRIKGAYPLFEREIRNRMTLFPGDRFVREKLSLQEKRITELFKRNGYISPKVKVSGRDMQETSGVELLVEIDKGPYYTISAVDIQGNRNFSAFRLLARTEIGHAMLFSFGKQRFVEEELNRDIRNLEDFYRKKKFPEVQIEKKIQKQDRQVEITLVIHEGPLYSIEIKGNDEFYAFQLKKEIPVYEYGNKNDLGVKKGVRNILEKYRKLGYPQASVTTEESISEKNGQKHKTISFVITEGRMQKVASLEIRGNSVFDDKRIKQQMLTSEPGLLNKGRFVQEVFKEDISAIKAFYRNNGYLSANVESRVEWDENKENANVIVVVEPKEQTLVGAVDFVEKDSPHISQSDKDALFGEITLKPGAPFVQTDLQDNISRVAAHVSKSGYPHVKVDTKIIDHPENSTKDIVFTIDKGKYTETGDIFILGNLRTKEKMLKEEVDMEAKEPFSLQKTLEAKRRFQDMDIFDSVELTPIGLSEKNDRVDILFGVREKKPYVVEASLGYDTRRKGFGGLSLLDRNCLGRNMALSLSGEMSEIGYEGEFKLLDPRFLNKDISSSFSIFTKEEEERNKTYGIRTKGASVWFGKTFWKVMNSGLSITYEIREQFDGENGAGKELEKRTAVVTSPSAVVDLRDDFLRPKNGFYGSFAVDLSKGVDSEVDDFIKYSFDGRYYHTPFSRLTLAFNLRLGYLYPYGEEKAVPDDQLFFLGGIADVRGFDENMLRKDNKGKPLGGKSAISGTIETRFDLGLGFELALFLDAGRIGDPVQEDGESGFRETAGAGLRYHTPIGPVGILYGHKLDKRDGESAGEVHFSIGYTF